MSRIRVSASDQTVSGKAVILGVALLSLAAAGAGWWYVRGQQARPLELWGAEHAVRILRAPQAELWELLPDEEAQGGADRQTLDGQQFTVVRHDLAGVAGLATVRQSLLQDGSFDWSAEVAERPRWRHALVFTDRDGQTIVLATATDPAAIGLPGGRIVSLAPAAGPMAKFFEQVAAQAIEP